MKNRKSVRFAALSLVFGAGTLAVLQPAAAAESAVPARIVEAIRAGDTVRLTGNTHPLAAPEFDRGLVDASRRLDRMMLVLQRSPAQDQALAAFNERQQDSFSPDYHHWLTADEFGRLYGPADADVAQVTAWLKAQGFTVDQVNEGKVTLEFSGTVAQVQSAFGVQMHRYVVDEVEHLANDRDPQIPRALAPVINGIVSLNDFRPKSQMVRGQYVRRDRVTGRITALAAPSAPAAPSAAAKSGGMHPQLGYTDTNGNQREDITPYDFATIYNVLPLWRESTPIIGTGVSVAIVAGSDVTLSDVATFRKSFGLPAKTPTVIHNGTDPGEDGVYGNQGENTLDVEMVSAAAPGANVILVVSGNTSTTPGFELSLQYIVSKQTAPILSMSYGSCELQLGKSGNAFFNSVEQQGATEGISMFVSAGDQGSAGCDHHQTYADSIGLQPNGMASTPYVTAVGGTDFTWSFSSTPDSAYWSSTNNADGANAKGYIPEVPWNSTCTNPLLLKVFTNSDGSPEFANSEDLCNTAAQTSGYEGLVAIGAGSGGVSDCTTPSGSTVSSCSGGYAKPSWQTGTGVPADGKRDLPDVSLFSSNWTAGNIIGSAILYCITSGDSPSCDYSDPNYIIYQETGGTSAASPYLAGIMALVMQKTGSKQGLANPTFYKLAAKDNLSSCKSSSVSVAGSNSCVFYDVTSGTIAQACYTGDPNCTTNTSGDEYGILSGYTAGTGYDRATGLGSVNATNLVNDWSSVTPAPAATLSPSTLTFASTHVGSTSTTQTVTVKNTGSTALALTNGGIAFTGANASSFTKAATTCSSSLAVGASCTITVEFKPAAAGALSAKLSVADNAVGSPQTVALNGTGTSTYPAVKLSATSVAFGNQKSGSTSAAKSFTVTNSGTASLALTSITLTGTEANNFSLSKTCGSTLAANASCTVSVTFKPVSKGAKAATVSVADNATGSPQKVAVSGSGT